MEAGPPLPSDIYTADWWARFFAWERSVQNEFVQEAVETTLGLPRNWADTVWGDIREAHDAERVHVIAQPFDVRHAMALLCTNHIDWRDYGVEQKAVLTMIDLHNHHPEMVFEIQNLTLKGWREFESVAEQRLEREFAWIWGWRNFCWETEEGEIRKRDILNPDQHGKN